MNAAPCRAQSHRRVSAMALTLVLSCLTASAARTCLAVEVLEFEPATSQLTLDVHPGTGEIYATETNRIAVYSRSGALVRQINLPQPTTRGFQFDLRVNAAGDVLFNDNNGFMLFDAAGALVTDFKQTPEWTAHTTTPVALAPDGRVYVARPGAIEEFTRQGAFVRSFDLPAADPFRQAIRVDVGSDGLIHLLSHQSSPGIFTRTIEVLDPAGALVRSAVLPSDPPLSGESPFANDLQIAPNGDWVVATRGKTFFDVYDSAGQHKRTIYPGMNYGMRDAAVTPEGGLAIREFLDGSRIRIFSPAETAELSPQRALRHFVDGPFGWTETIHGESFLDEPLDNAGIGRANAQSETTAGAFRVPGELGVLQNVEVTWQRVIYEMDSFGMFDPTAINIDPIAQPREYARAALSTGRVLFRGSELPSSNPNELSLTKTFSMTGGSTVAFFFTREGATSRFEQIIGPAPNPLPPLYSIEGINGGGFDQMIAFAANGRTLIGVEDIAAYRTTPDNNFSDQLFTFNVQLIPIPVPEPASGPLALSLACLLVGCVRRTAI